MGEISGIEELGLDEIIEFRHRYLSRFLDESSFCEEARERSQNVEIHFECQLEFELGDITDEDARLKDKNVGKMEDEELPGGEFDDVEQRVAEAVVEDEVVKRPAT